MPDFPDLAAFPSGDGYMPSATLRTTINAFGVLTAQDADDLHVIYMHMALGPSPKDGFASLALNADTARDLAKHLNHLAEHAELGVEAPTPEDA